MHPMSNNHRLPATPSTHELLIRRTPHQDFEAPTDKDQRDWLMSSLELRQGLNVREIVDTLPAELLDLI